MGRRDLLRVVLGVCGKGQLLVADQLGRVAHDQVHLVQVQLQLRFVVSPAMLRQLNVLSAEFRIPPTTLCIVLPENLDFKRTILSVLPIDNPNDFAFFVHFHLNVVQSSNVIYLRGGGILSKLLSYVLQISSTELDVVLGCDRYERLQGNQPGLVEV